MNFGEILRKSSILYSDNTAIAYGEQRQTFKELYDRSCRLANGLLDLGVEPGDRVAVLEDNSTQSLERIGGLAAGGFVRAPMYTQNVADVHVYMLNLIGARALIVDEQHLKSVSDRLADVPTLEHVIVSGSEATEHQSYSELIENASSDHPRPQIDEGSNHIIRFSAGTTGRPKGIVHTQRLWLQLGNELALALPRIGEDDSYLAAGPLSHASGLLAWPLITNGASHVILGPFDPAKFLEIIETDRITLSLLVPTMIAAIANHPDAKKRELSSLRAMFYGASPITERTLKDALGAWGNIMYQLYGQSENVPLTVLTPRHHIIDGTEEERSYLRSAGRPTPNTLLRIVDDEGNEVPNGQLGEIAALGPGRMKEIWGDPEATAARVTSDGFVRTRDVGYVDERGFLFLADRMEDLIISGGFNIWPAEVENALASHPAVLESAVVGVPDEKWGEAVLGVVVLREGHEATEEELIEHCRELIGSVKKPARVEFVREPLPKSAVGKLVRRQVRERYWTDEDRQIRGA